MPDTIHKPSFREVIAVSKMILDDVGLTFNAQRVGPGKFRKLRDADYSLGYRMSAMPELVPLIYASFENTDYQKAQNVVDTLRQYWLTGNTGILYVPKGMFVQDIPELISTNRRISMNQEALEKRLGSNEEKGVVFSDDKNIRFVPYGFKRQSQTPLELSKNPGVIALTGSEENAEKLAKASEHYRKNPYFLAVDKVNSPQIRIAVLGSGGGLGSDRLNIGSYWGSGGYGCAFGVLEDAEGIVAKK